MCWKSKALAQLPLPPMHSLPGRRLARFLSALLFMSLVARLPALASNPLPTCSSSAVDAVLKQSTAAEEAGDFAAIARADTAFSEQMARCYASGRNGGPYFGQTPLSDLLASAGSLSNASLSWRNAHNRVKQCQAATKATQLYVRVLSDKTVSTPPVVNDDVRKVGAIGLATARRNAQGC